MKSLKAKFRKSDTNEWSKNDERLLQAVDHGETDKVVALLGKKGVVATKLDSEGKTALHLAAMKGNAECLRVMLTHGVDVSAQDTAGHSALHVAVKNNHIECVKRLLQAKCPVDCVDNAGKTCLHYAAANGSIPAVQLLTEQKCPLNIKDSDGNTPLLLSVLYGHTEVGKYLLDHRADADIKDKNGRTALMLACESGNFNMVDILVRKGADLKIMDGQGQDAVHYSRQSRNSQILNLLLSKTSQEPGLKTPTHPLQLSDMSSPMSSTSTPLSAKGQVFFPEQTNKEDISSLQRDYKDRLSDSTGADSLLDVSSEAEHQDTLSLLQAKVTSLTLQNKELQDKLQEKAKNEFTMDISSDSYHSTQTELNLSVAKSLDEISPTGISDNSDISVESQLELTSSELKVKQLEKVIEDLQIKLDCSEAERKTLDAEVQSAIVSYSPSVREESASDGDISLQEPVDENKETQKMLQSPSQDNVEHQNAERQLLEEYGSLRRDYEGILEESERKQDTIKDLQHQIDVMKQSMDNMVSMERLEDMEKTYYTMIEKINQEKVQLSEKYKEELEGLRKEMESQKAPEALDGDGQAKEAMTKTIEELSKQVSELSLLYNDAKAEIGQKRQDLSGEFISKHEHVQIVQEMEEEKNKVEKDLMDLATEHARTLQEMKEQPENEKEISEHLQVIAGLKIVVHDLEVERNDFREILAVQESKVKSLEEDLQQRKSIQETMITRKSFEQLQTALEDEINMLSSELGELMKEKEKLSVDNVQVKRELVQLKGEVDSAQTQLSTKEQEVNEFRLKYERAQEDLNDLKRFSENTAKLEEDKDKKINELSKEVSKLKEALNSLSQLSFSTNTTKRQSQQLEAVQQQVKQLQNQLVETKKQHQEIVSVYRMHLLYAVQGQMDEDVQKVLKQILTMCKSQSQKI
ncbi:ankycorbin isoform 2-T2 [Discoglossus pictus]